jgi:uncharacterized protein
MSELAPVSPRERLVALDILRGLALCGVMIGNMVLYSGRWARSGPRDDLSTLDQVADWFLQIVVQSKAQTLLTLLFGFGFAIQLVRAEERGEPVMAMYVRRLIVLFVFGALHVVLLWWGDVTWTYAVAGFGLLAFLHTSNRTRVVWGLIFTFVPVLVYRIEEVFMASLRVFIEPMEFAAHTARMAAALRGPDHAGLWWEHLQYTAVWCSRIYGWYFLWTLGRFLLGYVAGKLHWFDNDGADHLPVFRRLVLWGGAVAVVTTAVSLLVGFRVLPLPSYGLWGRMLLAACIQAGYLAQTLAYVGIVMLLVQRPWWRRVLGILAPAGRMPLTVYFSQSVICTFIFYGWGLGWSGSVGVAGQVGLAFAIFAVQLALCHVWIRHFRFGPLEWVWRTAVYLKLQPMRL